ncbi:MAG: sigma-70 family RNA polymerase sigma factor [Verrucomicrobia bacterium]|nr:sigma-70 family RNA polymerase sigma factor [Verrucomicrobiota bacterium]
MERDEGLKIYLSEIDNAKPLTPMQEGASEEGKVRAGLIRANLRLVVKIAQEQRASSEMSILDLISAGNIGLIKAVERFDPSKEGDLASFASWWIRQSIKRAMSRSAKKIPAFGQTPPDKGSDEDLALPA